MCFVLLNGKKLLVPLLLRHTNVTNATNALSTVAFFCFFVFLIIVFVNLFTYRLKLFLSRLSTILLQNKITLSNGSNRRFPCTQDKLWLHVINIANNTLLADLFLLFGSEKENVHDSWDLLTTMDRVVFTWTLKQI